MASIWLDSIFFIFLRVCYTAGDEIVCLPPHVENGDFRPKAVQYQHEDPIEIVCDAGFQSSALISRCTAQGWQPPATCTQIKCLPPHVENGDFRPKGVQYQYEDPIEIVCDAGFSSSALTSRCTQQGWQPPAMCIPKGCGYVHLQNGAFYPNQPPSTFPKRVGYKIYYSCDSGFLSVNKRSWQSTACIISGWDPEPKCFKRCDHTKPFRNGRFIYGYWTSPFIEGNTIIYSCNKGYYPAEMRATVTCTKDGWSPRPRCASLANAPCGDPPVVDNADIIEERSESYLPGKELHYRCHENFGMSGSDTIRCKGREWSEPPRCEGKCDRPPSIDNGDILEMSKPKYMPGEKVHYKCQRLYRMDGNAEVSCSNGHWTQPPTCTVPCTASEEDMKSNNIRLKWITNSKFYVESGDTIEFICRRGHYPDPASPPFRVQCREGRVEYPRCVRQVQE